MPNFMLKIRMEKANVCEIITKIGMGVYIRIHLSKIIFPPVSYFNVIYFLIYNNICINIQCIVYNNYYYPII